MKISQVNNGEICFCPLFGLLDVIAKKWALLIIAILGNEGEKGFNELRSELDAISPRTLSQTLKKLDDIHLVKKNILDTSPPHVRYSLTEEGKELREFLIPLLIWVQNMAQKRLPGAP